MQTRAQNLLRIASRNAALLACACLMLSVLGASSARAEEAQLSVSVQVVSTCNVTTRALDGSAAPVAVSCGRTQDKSNIAVAPVRTVTTSEGISMQVATATVNF